jgi:hypothetical protein
LGVSQTIEQHAYQGWGSYGYGPNYNYSFGHSESVQQIEHHERSWFGSADSFHFLADTSDFSNFSSGDYSSQSSRATHNELFAAEWSNPFEHGHVQATAYESNHFQQTVTPNHLSQQSESFAYHSSSVEIAYGPSAGALDMGDKFVFASLFNSLPAPDHGLFFH